MKSLVKLVLVVSLFSSVVLADGEMGTGGKTCTTPCLASTEPNEKEITTIESTDSVLSFVQEYLDSVFKYFEN